MYNKKVFLDEIDMTAKWYNIVVDLLNLPHFPIDKN